MCIYVYMFVCNMLASYTKKNARVLHLIWQVRGLSFVRRLAPLRVGSITSDVPAKRFSSLWLWISQPSSNLHCRAWGRHHKDPSQASQQRLSQNKLGLSLISLLRPLPIRLPMISEQLWIKQPRCLFRPPPGTTRGSRMRFLARACAFLLHREKQIRPYNGGHVHRAIQAAEAKD